MKGFTIIELLIVITITLILAAASVPIYGNLQVSAQLNENSAQIIQALRTAREYSVAGFNNVQHGVFFEINPDSDDRYILYQGSTYATRNSSYDRAVTLDSSLTLSTSLTGGANEVNFSKGLGTPIQIGTITLTHDASGSKVIVVNSFGMVEEQ
jgi:prepilin-type N-terminal cleavage/methylation domain-containing protein